MLNLVQPRVDVEQLKGRLRRHYPAMAGGLELVAGAGTGNRSFRARSRGGQWFVRVRNPKYADEAAMEFEHDVLRHLSRAGLPVHPPLLSVKGKPWARVGGACVQVSRWVEGRPFTPGNRRQTESAARFLSELHALGRSFLGDPRKQWDREDSFMIAFAGFDLVRNLEGARKHGEDLNAVARSIHRFLHELPPQHFWRLPQSIVHGDFHQGNMLFRGEALAGVFDWDYACEHPRLKDVANALMFLGARAPRPFDAADIRTYVQPVRLGPARVSVFLKAYEAAEPLTREEWKALPAMMVGRWLQIRSCAIIKLPADERLRVFCDGMAKTLDHLWRFVP